MKFKRLIAAFLVAVMFLSYVNFFPLNDVFASDKAQTTETQPIVDQNGESPPPLLDSGNDENQNAPPEETEDTQNNKVESTESTESTTETESTTDKIEETTPIVPTEENNSAEQKEPMENADFVEDYMTFSGSGSRDMSGTFCVRASNYGANLSNDGIGHRGDGALTNHVYGTSLNDFAICLDSGKPYGGGNNVVTTSASGENGSRTWASLGSGLRESLILLLVYGMDEDSGYARYTNTKKAYAAMQLIAWEWINDRRDGYYTCGPDSYYGTGRMYYDQEVNDIAGDLRRLVYSNPDKIDPYETKILLISPNSSSQQQTIAIDRYAVQEGPKTGDFSVTKNITGTGDRSGWRFQSYSSYSDAANERNPIETSYTNSSGVAYFRDYTAGNTYYVRESSYQDRKDTTGWVLSSNILSVTIGAGVTTNAGSISNMSPGKVSASKTIAPSELSNSTNLQGWKFELYKNQNDALNASNPWKSATTNSSGYVYFENLPAGTYYVREAPANRQTKDTNGWQLSTQVLSVQAKSGATSHAYAGSVTNTKYGSLSVAKHINGGGNKPLENWKFQLYSSISNAQSETSPVATAYTNSQGVAQFNNLRPGTTYYIREASRQDKQNAYGWTLDGTIHTGVVGAGKNVLVGTTTNVTPSQIAGKKSVIVDGPTTGKLNGWVFQISTTQDFTNIVKTMVSDDNGLWVTGYTLPSGTYYVREAPMESQTRPDKDKFTLDPTVITVQLTPGGNTFALQQGKDYTSQNKGVGKLQVQKAVENAESTPENLSGWIFNIYRDESCNDLVMQMPATNEQGVAISNDLPVGTYYVKEAPITEQTRQDRGYWTLSTNVVKVTVVGGKTTLVDSGNGTTATNILGKRVKVTKVADNKLNPDCFEQIKDNKMYTTEGAVYEVYINDVLSETVVTGPDGSVLTTKTYEVGTTGYIKEITAPRGYLLDSTPHQFTIVADDNVTYDVVVKNIPAFDPATQRFQKEDKETGKAQGNTSFEGAVLRWEYYDNDNWSGTPLRTWHFKTNNTGFYGYSPEYIDTSYKNDELYISANGAYQLPLGSVKVTEIVSPVGYKELPVMYANVKQTGDGKPAKWEYTKETLEFLKIEKDLYIGEEPEDPESLGSLAIEKLDKDYGKNPLNWGKLAGCEFTVYNRSTNPVKVGDYKVAQPGEACYVLVIGEDGTASTENIFPIGSYEVKETKGNDYYQVNKDWSYSFTVDGTQTNQAFSTTCENEVRGAKIEFEKINTNLEPIPGAKFVLQYSLDGETDWKPVFKSDTIVVGGCTSPELTDDGGLIVGETGKIVFEGLYPTIYYRFSEVATGNKYQLLGDVFYINSEIELTGANNLTRSYKVINNEIFELPKTGSVGMNWMIGISFVAAIATFCGVYVSTKDNKKKKF